MMNHFKVTYIPGGMGLDHSGWFLCEVISYNGVDVPFKHKYLVRSDYGRNVSS